MTQTHNIMNNILLLYVSFLFAVQVVVTEFNWFEFPRRSELRAPSSAQRETLIAQHQPLEIGDNGLGVSAVVVASWLLVLSR